MDQPRITRPASGGPAVAFPPDDQDPRSLAYASGFADGVANERARWVAQLGRVVAGMNEAPPWRGPAPAPSSEGSGGGGGEVLVMQSKPIGRVAQSAAAPHACDFAREPGSHYRFCVTCGAEEE